MLQIGFRNQRFDDAEPLYVDIGAGMVWNRLTHKAVTMTSLTTAMTADGYTPKTGEVGKASAAWIAANTGFWDGIATPPPPAPGSGSTTGAAITSSTAGDGTATAKITFAGGPALAHQTISLGVTTGTGTAKTIAGVSAVQVQKGDTIAATATAVAAALNGKKDTGNTVTLAAAAAGAVVTVTEAGGAVVNLTVTIA